MKHAAVFEPPADSVVEADIAAFATLLHQHYGPRLHGVYLFGSRARGEAGPDSDADIAVILDEVPEFWKELSTLCDLSFDFLVDDGVYIEAKPVALDAWNDPSRDCNPSLIRAMKRDGRPIGRPL